MAKDQKMFNALLNGIIRHDYYNETDITDQFLQQELYADLNEDDFQAMADKSRKILKVPKYRSQKSSSLCDTSSHT